MAKYAVSFSAAAQRELLASSVQATNQVVALWRSMVLGPLDYTPKTKAALVSMPFIGHSLFGPSLQAVLQGEVETSKALQGEKLLRETSAPKPRATRPPQVAAAYSRAPTVPAPKPQYQGPKGKPQGRGAKRPPPSKPFHSSKKAKGSGV